MRPSRDLAIMVGLVALLVIGVLAITRRDQPVGPPYRLDGHGPLGLSGLEAGLEASGHDVRRGVRPRIGDDGLTVLVAPEQFSRDEAGVWTESIERGATVLLALDRPDALTQELGLELSAGGPAAEVTAAGSIAFPDARAPASPVRATFSRLPEGAQTLFTSPSGPVMVVVPLGEGSVWAISDRRWLTNRAIEQTGLPITLPLATAAGGDVVVDEFHHGAGTRGGSFGYLPGFAQLVLLQLLVAGLATALTLARRLGAVQPQREPMTRSTAELAVSMARMHRSAKRIDAATAPLAVDMRRRLSGLEPRAAEPLTRLENARSEADAVLAYGEVDRITRRVTGADG